MPTLDLIFAARPLLHLPIWSIFLVSLHYHHALSGGGWDKGDLGIMVMLSLLASSAYYVNQMYDVESDRLNGKVPFLDRGCVSRQGLIVSALVTSGGSLILSLLYTKTIVVIACQLLMLAIAYSVPPMRLKDRPVAGLLSNAYGYGFLVPFTVMPELNVGNSGLLGWDNPFYFLYAVGGIYVMTTISDVRGDSATGKRTIAVAFGPTRCYMLAIVLLGGALWFALRSNYSILAVIAIASLGAVMIAALARSERLNLFATKLPILLLTILAGWWYPLYLLFIIALILGTRLYYKRRFDMIYPQLA